MPRTTRLAASALVVVLLVGGSSVGLGQDDRAAKSGIPLDGARLLELLEDRARELESVLPMWRKGLCFPVITTDPSIWSCPGSVDS